MYRLIIADDEENIRNGMAHSLPWREWGYEVVALCASGQEVLDRMEGAGRTWSCPIYGCRGWTGWS